MPRLRPIQFECAPGLSRAVRRNRMLFRGPGFTLIELLIVVAIIAVLAAIAVPNMLEAQVRAKVSRVKADMRSLSTAAEAYGVDNNAYPPNNGLNPADPQGMMFNVPRMLLPLSTPVAYISSALLPDPFRPGKAPVEKRILIYTRLHQEEGLLSVLYPMAGITPEEVDRAAGHAYYFQSIGPDGKSLYEQCVEQTGNAGAGFALSIQTFIRGCQIYDPTNGTTSKGDISRTARGFIERPF